MSLFKILKYVERYATKTALQGEYTLVPADNKPFIISLLKNRIKLHYPTCTIDEQSQHLEFSLEKAYSVDGDMENKYSMKITMGEEFMDHFTEHYPEGLI